MAWGRRRSEPRPRHSRGKEELDCQDDVHSTSLTWLRSLNWPTITVRLASSK